MVKKTRENGAGETHVHWRQYVAMLVRAPIKNRCEFGRSNTRKQRKKKHITLVLQMKQSEEEIDLLARDSLECFVIAMPAVVQSLMVSDRTQDRQMYPQFLNKQPPPPPFSEMNSKREPVHAVHIFFTIEVPGALLCLKGNQ